jgi:hypothetical protein
LGQVVARGMSNIQIRNYQEKPRSRLSHLLGVAASHGACRRVDARSRAKMLTEALEQLRDAGPKTC